MEREPIIINYDDFFQEIVITRPGSDISIHKHENYIKLITKKNGYCIQNNRIITKSKSNNICSITERKFPQLPEIDYFSYLNHFGYKLHPEVAHSSLTRYGTRFSGLLSIDMISSKNERIKILSKELFFHKRYKELTEAVRVYKQRRKENIQKGIDKNLPFVLSKIIEEYVQRN